jgi:N6-adenosine-specific RNA methylase IME4
MRSASLGLYNKALTIVTWCKNGPGVGHYVQNNTEHVLLGAKGRAIVPECKPLSSWFQWPRRGHSVKPDEFFELVMQVSPGPYLELFARKPRDSFHVWGHEVASDIDLALSA